MTKFIFSTRTADADSAAELTDLARWIGDRDELGAQVDVRTRPPAEGELGGVADAVAVMAAATPLAKAFFDWLTERAKSRKVSIDIARADGKRLRVELEGGASAADLLPEVRSFFAEGGDAIGFGGGGEDSDGSGDDAD
ncbi:MAG TPA: hypothetical protein VFW33_03225 [Gemmataceae bacterium]|nr:hypothetical protein [Gemmataceae bacterium]